MELLLQAEDGGICNIGPSSQSDTCLGSVWPSERRRVPVQESQEVKYAENGDDAQVDPRHQFPLGRV